MKRKNISLQAQNTLERTKIPNKNGRNEENLPTEILDKILLANYIFFSNYYAIFSEISKIFEENFKDKIDKISKWKNIRDKFQHIEEFEFYHIIKYFPEPTSLLGIFAIIFCKGIFGSISKLWNFWLKNIKNGNKL